MDSGSNEENIVIDDKYLVIEKVGSGATANVYKVKEIDSNKIYAAKVLKKSDEYFEEETNILKLIKHPFIVNMIKEGEGTFAKKAQPPSTKKYIILDYAEKGNLFDYIYLPKKKFEEKNAKMIFSKILNGVLECHKRGICHRDLKLENILLDEKFNPKIADFGFATLAQGSDGSGILRTPLGTMTYAAPEILLKRGYDGIKADIFSLGPLLFNLVTGKIGFCEATKKDSYYRLIMIKKYKDYWNAVSSQIPETSQEFKDLFIKMVCYDPKSRISIEQILEKDPWLKEIRDLNEDQKTELETEIYNDFLKREEIVKEESAAHMETDNEFSDFDGENARGVGDKEYFSLDLKIKYEKTGLNMKDFIKIDGEINPVKFMNTLANKIKENNECSIEADQKTYKFLVDFENEEENKEEEIPDDILEELKKLDIEEKEGEDEDEDEMEGVEKVNSCIQVKLLQSFTSGYIVRFMKKKGELDDYYKNLNKIKEIIGKKLI